MCTTPWLTLRGGRRRKERRGFVWQLADTDVYTTSTVPHGLRLPTRKIQPVNMPRFSRTGTFPKGMLHILRQRGKTLKTKDSSCTKPAPKAAQQLYDNLLMRNDALSDGALSYNDAYNGKPDSRRNLRLRWCHLRTVRPRSGSRAALAPQTVSAAVRRVFRRRQKSPGSYGPDGQNLYRERKLNGLVHPYNKHYVYTL